MAMINLLFLVLSHFANASEPSAFEAKFVAQLNSVKNSEEFYKKIVRSSEQKTYLKSIAKEMSQKAWPKAELKSGHIWLHFNKQSIRLKFDDKSNTLIINGVSKKISLYESNEKVFQLIFNTLNPSVSYWNNLFIPRAEAVLPFLAAAAKIGAFIGTLYRVGAVGAKFVAPVGSAAIMGGWIYSDMDTSAKEKCSNAMEKVGECEALMRKAKRDLEKLEAHKNSVTDAIRKNKELAKKNISLTCPKDVLNAAKSYVSKVDKDKVDSLEESLDEGIDESLRLSGALKAAILGFTNSTLKPDCQPEFDNLKSCQATVQLHLEAVCENKSRLKTETPGSNIK